MIKRSERTLTAASRVATALTWTVAALLLAGIIGWHDHSFGGYWGKRFDAGKLFLTQRGFAARRAPSPEPGASRPIWITIMRFEADLSVGLLAASAVVVLVNAVNPSRDRRVWRGPGAVACVVAVVAMGVCVLEERSKAIKTGQSLWRWGHPVHDPFPNSWPLCEMRICLAVLGAWVAMAAIGRFRPRGTWSDRFGLVVGSLWMVVMVYRVVASFFIPFGNVRY